MKANLTIYVRQIQVIFSVCALSLNLVILHAVMTGQSQKAKFRIIHNQSTAHGMIHHVCVGTQMTPTQSY